MKKTLIAQPNTSRRNKTGSWRTFKPEINPDICIGCTTCTKVCPEGTIKMINLKGRPKAKIDYDYCKGCGLCAAECPVKAIIMKPEAK
ncbi:pyruvate synthase [Candidatus Falkowbacteria bacterium CG10_big_fil_rev_8_21_14_0_10_39_9]|uniref:Pyruvate synthase n=1 Tax=Candidatus Falkowbacteria bacterium CG10_big_fil_rev_8_21_14_0_10_39_9 TaxID=1974566 RepID=A0A2M6WQ95_9BACT|nr:MAG: pyruvate synthase [Candidatus Falkowbacteria bacterium CG10_big_fil_rev_8_21_14_0_10_39_9]